MSARIIPPPRASGFTESTDAPLYWCSYGAAGGDRLLLLHGGPGAHHDYLLPQMLRLERGTEGGQRELLFYDQRGGGRSRLEDAARQAPITWQTHVHDLDRVIAELRVDPPLIVAYSWGALLALLYAREAARGTVGTPPAALVLIDPAPLSRQYREAFEREFARRQSGAAVQALREELAASGLRDSDPALYRHRSFELSVAGYFADPRAARDLTPFRITGRVQQSVWESLGDFDLIRDLEQNPIAPIPTFIVHGREDPIPLESSQRCARALGAQLVVLSQCGHVPYVEQPDALFPAIERFLSSSRAETR